MINRYIQIREAIKKHFKSSGEAFEHLDLDMDGKLSAKDFQRGLCQVRYANSDYRKKLVVACLFTWIHIHVPFIQLGLNLRDEQLHALINRGDFDKDEFMDYYEFVVKYGLEMQVPGKWIFQVFVRCS
jgi:Ca2+-binding EF-hand superfamily protein